MYIKSKFSARAFNGPLKLALVGLTLFFVATSPSFLIAQSTSRVADPAPDTEGQLDAEKTWSLKSESQTLEAIESWVDESSGLPKDALKNAVSAFNEFVPDNAAEESSFSANRLDRVLAVLASVRPDIARITSQLSGQRNSVVPPNFSHVLDNQSEHSFVQNHVRLLFGRWLSQNQFYDEALEQLNLVDIDTVMAPESVLFYRALAEHQLLQKSECQSSIETLLQHEDDLPVRFTVVAKIMQADLTPVKDGSLDEISRMMKDIYRRTQFQRSGTLVLKQEAAVIDKLGKLIEDLEQQQQQQQQQQQAQGGPGQGSPRPGRPDQGSDTSDSPMEDSNAAGGQGDGSVRSKNLADGGQWGDMNPAERSAAMAEMVKDMPPHYRSAIEAYFRRLAQEGSK